MFQLGILMIWLTIIVVVNLFHISKQIRELNQIVGMVLLDVDVLRSELIGDDEDESAEDDGTLSCRDCKELREEICDLEEQVSSLKAEVNRETGDYRYPPM